MGKDKQLLKEQLLHVVNYDDAQNKVNDLCKEYITNNLREKYPKLINKIIPIIEYTSITFNKTSNDKSKDIVRITVYLVFTIIGCIIFNIWKMPIIGTLIGSIAGVTLFKYIYSVLSKSGKTDDSLLVDSICTKMEEAINEYGKICVLLNKVESTESVMPSSAITYTSPLSNNDESSEFVLETKYMRILEWFHSTFEAIEGNEWIEKDITKLLNRYGYDFIEYSESDRDNFRKTVGNVDKPTTTVPALVNIKTNRCLIEGFVIMPR